MWINLENNILSETKVANHKKDVPVTCKNQKSDLIEVDSKILIQVWKWREMEIYKGW